MRIKQTVTPVNGDGHAGGHEKIFWTAKEKGLIVTEAVRLQHDDHALSGLPLLRKAQKVLPRHRQRVILTLGQVKWFEPMLALASKAAEAAAPGTVLSKLVDHPDDPYVPILSNSRDLMAQVEIGLSRVIEQNARFFDQNERIIAGNEAILKGHEAATRRYEDQTDRLIASIKELIDSHRKSADQMDRLLAERKETNRHLTVQDENARAMIAQQGKLIGEFARLTDLTGRRVAQMDRLIADRADVYELLKRHSEEMIALLTEIRDAARKRPR